MNNPKEMKKFQKYVDVKEKDGRRSYEGGSEDVVVVQQTKYGKK